MSHDLARLPAHELTARLYQLRRRERRLLVELLLHIGEVDRRKLYLELAFPSLFAFLEGYLGYSGGSAFRRCTAARLLARFPVLAEYLADGRLSLATLVELRDVLDEDRLDEVLARAAGRTEKEVQQLVAALRPRPAVPDLVRRLPAAPAAVDAPAAAPAPVPPSRPGRVEPLSATQHLLRATVSDDFVRDLDLVRAALSHKLPGGSLEAVLHECLRVTLGMYEKRRRDAGQPATAPANDNRGSRYIPAAVRDEVWRRDGGCCAFVAADGRRCESRQLLQFHHVVPFARGGAATVEQIALRCAGHNRLEAEHDFGAAHVEAAIQRARESPRPRPRPVERQGSLF